MKTKNKSAVDLGRIGGLKKSTRKSTASARNGLMGGRPKATAVALETARGWIDARGIDAPESGYVVTSGRSVAGWAPDLFNPRHWVPGCYAVPVAGGRIHVSAGGSSESGAVEWLEMLDGVAEKR